MRARCGHHRLPLPGWPPCPRDLSYSSPLPGGSTMRPARATVQPQAGGCVRPQAASSPPQFLGCVRHHGRPSHHLPPRLRTSRGRTRRSSGFTASTPLLPQHALAVAVPAVTMARVPHISSGAAVCGGRGRVGWPRTGARRRNTRRRHY